MLLRERGFACFLAHLGGAGEGLWIEERLLLLGQS